MRHECLVIGGGLAGLTAGIRCAEAGLKVAVVTSGESGLSFASGAIDVLGYQPSDSSQPIRFPFEGISELVANHPEHPYAFVGRDGVAEAMDWFQGQLAEGGLKTFTSYSEESNQWRVTATGALRPTWLMQSGPDCLPWIPAKMKRVVFANISGFLDFMPELAAQGLKRHPSFRNVQVDSLTIDLPLVNGLGATADTMRAPQLCRALGSRDFDIIASTLIEKVQDASLVVLPACLDSTLETVHLNDLRRRTGLNIVDAATLPPSLPGMHIHQALRHRFAALGGFLIPATEIRHALVKDGRVLSVSNGEDLLSADHFILASGSFFSKGLHVNPDLNASEPFTQPLLVREPIFDLDLTMPTTSPAEFSDRKFLSRKGHGFIRTGVKLNADGQPEVKGKALHNLHVAGTILGGCDPVQECSAGGVSISTAWRAAGKVVAEVQAAAVNKGGEQP
ncbi:glycerol-3-phosphate dehydrogenase subunit GlpB [Parendozoicomonas haliclonae]|uniref:Anaerobic glycerol-3-phosphate dehydrogenase subunit B n=1 Tax=Parendozoicomonas haliclonae TaxID=1960125 RepID=A0A1X7AKX0_9GAMM|nr:glycerol-3-phosphate dehydrogenase subunit GlpB [Parendozoicomonas haliclonae]SMA48311.1 Anaerobic glycerol-3-phosphate dehydrogenase subunit B [Parendozoicomonas haliclonae]